MVAVVVMDVRVCLEPNHLTSEAYQMRRTERNRRYGELLAISHLGGLDHRQRFLATAPVQLLNRHLKTLLIVFNIGLNHTKLRR